MVESYYSLSELFDFLDDTDDNQDKTSDYVDDSDAEDTVQSYSSLSELYDLLDDTEVDQVKTSAYGDDSDAVNQILHFLILLLILPASVQVLQCTDESSPNQSSVLQTDRNKRKPKSSSTLLFSVSDLDYEVENSPCDKIVKSNRSINITVTQASPEMKAENYSSEENFPSVVEKITIGKTVF